VKRLFFHSLCICVLITVSCKKNSPTNVKEPIAEPPTVEATIKYDGLFVSTWQYIKPNGTYSLTQVQTSAFISDQPVIDDAYNKSYLLDLGSVKAGTVTLKNQRYGTKFYYDDSLYTIQSLPFKWTIAGANKIDSFSFINKKPVPATTPVQWPDSASIAAGFVFRTTKQSNCTLIRLLIYSNNGLINKFYKGTDTVLNIQPGELTDYGITPNAPQTFYTITFYNDNLWNINNRPLNFRNAVSFANNPIKLKP
jgi:hypothetical protein